MTRFVNFAGLILASAVVSLMAQSSQEALVAGEEQKVDQKPSHIEEIDANHLRIGEVHLQVDNREITFPAQVNMREGLLEYAAVTPEGKVHESLLVSPARPLDLNVALKLVGYPGSLELFDVLDKDYRPTGVKHDPAADIREASRLLVEVSYELNGEKKRRPLSELISHRPLEKAMPAGPWLYTGSYLHEGKFKAEMEGDLLAISTFASSPINYAGPDHDSDEVWFARTAELPEIGAPLTLHLMPAPAALPHLLKASKEAPKKP